MALRARDYRKILDITVEVLDSRAAETAWELFVARLVDALSGEVGWMYSGVDLGRNTGRPCAWSPGTVGRQPLGSLLRANMGVHPLARYLATTKDPTPLTVHDVISDRAWRNNPARAALLATFGVTRQIALSVPEAPGTWRCCIVSRSGSDFTPADREFARQIQPVLTVLDRHLSELPRLPAQPEINLTPRELTVLALLTEGLTAGAIAHRLGITTRTAVKHLEHIYRKCGTSDRLTTVLLAQEIGLISR